MRIPAEVRDDPTSLQEFVISHMDRVDAESQLPRYSLSDVGAGGSGPLASPLADPRARGDAHLARRAESFLSSNPEMAARAAKSKGGVAGFLDRFKSKAVPIRATSTRVKVIAVGSGGSGTSNREMKAGLLANADHV